LTLPKDKIWYELENRVVEHKLVIDGEEVENGLIFLDVKNGNIIFQDMEVLKFENLEVLPLLLYNQVTISNVTMGENLSQFSNLSLDEIVLTYGVATPEKAVFTSEGNFGNLRGRISFLEQHIDILLFPSEELLKERSIMKNFEKDANSGGYLYNGKF
jgi:hypothetical protein